MDWLFSSSSSSTTTTTTTSSKDINEIYNRLDINNDGYISIDELEIGCKNLKIPVSKKGIIVLFKSIDVNNDNKITVQEFEIFVNLRKRQIKKVFDKFDSDNNGTISSDELRFSVQSLGYSISNDQLRLLMSKLSSGSTTRITLDKFTEALMLLPTVNPEGVFDAYFNVDDAQSEYTLARDPKSKSNQTMLDAILQQLYAGGIAGAISRTVTAPIERLKTLAQAAPPGQKSTGLVNGMKAIYSEGGVRGFFRGNFANCIKIAPETATKFIAFDECKKLIAKDVGNTTTFEKFFAGGIAGSIAQFTVYPLETLKTRLSVSPPGTYSSIFNCFMSVLKQEGPLRFYKGAGASIIGIIPYAGVDLSVNSIFKEQATLYYSKLNSEPPVYSCLLGGMVSSSCAMIITYPLNLVRTRLQTSGLPGRAVYSSAFQVIQETLKVDGFKGLYRGILPNMLKVLPSTSISYAVYDIINNRK